MRKSVNRPEYPAVVGCLIAARKNAALTQVELAARLRRSQAYVSAVEGMYRRTDLLQVVDWCRACGLTLAKLGSMVDDALAREPERAAPVKKTSKRAPKRRRLR